MATDARALIMHVVHRFDVGGLENGVVNLINHLPAHEFRHLVVALTEVTRFADRVRAPDVEFIALEKRPGHLLPLYPRLMTLMRERRPAIVHTRNLGALEAVVPAWAAGVPARIHGEHGREMHDLDSRRQRYIRVRKLYRPFVSHWVALSRDLAADLVERVGVDAARVSLVCNGVDTAQFRPASAAPRMPQGFPFDRARHWIVGTVGRMQAVKSPLALVDAFVRVIEHRPALRERLRLVLVGEGPQRAACEARLDAAGVRALAWLPGERADIAPLLGALDAFVLPSLAEGISNTLLEAMATGLPVIATAVGGNVELVRDGVTGILVPAADADALAAAIERLADDPARAAAMGRAGRAAALQDFALQTMVERYRDLYRRRVRGALAQLQRA